jgi:hypothetical protein
MNIQHSSESELWYTPQPIIDASTKVLGHIDLDPASDAFGNSRVGADRYYTEQDNGLIKPWALYEDTKVFTNPPGGKIGNKSIAGLFWDKLMNELTGSEGFVSHAIFVGFNLSILRVSQNSPLSILDFQLCVPSQRIRFDHPNEAKASPSHDNVIVNVISPKVDIVLKNSLQSKFYEEFKVFGAVR